MTEKDFRGNGSLGYFIDNEERQNVKNARVLVIGYDFKLDKDMDRSANLTADLKNIEDVFEKSYNLLVTQIIGKGKKELFETLQRESLADKMKIKNVPVDLLIVFIMSHGRQNGIILTDTKMEDGQYETFYKQELLNTLNAIDEFKDALKLYFVGPCRGGNLEKCFPAESKVELAENAVSVRPPSKIEPSLPNHVILYSSVEDTPAVTEPSGSWMVKNVCYALKLLERDIPLELFLTKVIGRTVNNHILGSSIAQTPEFQMNPHKQFFFKKFTKLDAQSKLPTAKEVERQSFYPWKTDSGENLAPGRAYIFYDDQHEYLIENFKGCFIKLGLDVHPLKIGILSDQLSTIAKALDDEGMLLICCLCKLVQTETGLEMSYTGITQGQENISSVTGVFTSTNCPKMTGKAKVFFFLNNGLNKDEEEQQKIYVKTTNHGNNHSDNLCFYAMGNSEFGNKKFVSVNL